MANYNLKINGNFLSRAKDFYKTLYYIAAICAMIFAAHWFTQQEKALYNANTYHSVSHYNINKRLYLLILEITIDNIGNVPIEIDYLRIWIQEILPLAIDKKELLPLVQLHPNKQIKWPYIREIEERGAQIKIKKIKPGEKEKIVRHFVIEKQKGDHLVKITSEIENKEEKPAGWTQTTLYKFK